MDTIKFGGCPFCGSQSCIAGQCQSKAKQEQGEPVAWIHEDERIGYRALEWKENVLGYRGVWKKIPLYTTPQQRKQEQGVPMAGQGAELYQQMIEAIQKLLAASKEPSRWGAVGPDAEDIAWGQVTALLTHICVGIDSPPIKQEQGEPVGEILLTNGDYKEVSWKNGKLPPVGAKLYTTPQSDQEYVSKEAWRKTAEDALKLADISQRMANRSAIATTPQQRKPLTDEQIDEIVWNSARQHTLQGMAGRISISIGRAIEAAHGIKENA